MHLTPLSNLKNHLALAPAPSVAPGRRGGSLQPLAFLRFLFTLALSLQPLTFLLAFPAATRAADAPLKPNVVFILADDLGWADVSFHGGDIKTPNLDKLAAAGARLEQFYVQPVCSPTRASLMTGRYPLRHGLQVGVVRPHAQYGLPLDERTLPQALKEAGYFTAIAGKWHLGHFAPAYLPTHRGFDSQYGHYNGALDYNTHIRDGGLDWHRNDHGLVEEGYSTHLVAREAVRVIRESDQAKPFFLYVPFNAVHAPHQVPESYCEPYNHLTPSVRRTYAGMVSAFDEAVGKIVAALDEKGLRKKTLIIFSSDNGGPSPGVVTSNGPLRAGKGTLYEGGLRVAAFATWEGRIPAGTTVNAPLHMVDWYPTLLNLAGAPMKQAKPLDGRDAWPAITQGKPTPHEYIVHNTTPFNGAIRKGDWKLVINGQARDTGDAPAETPAETAKKKKKKTVAATAATTAEGEQIELFNIASDPYEKNNLAASEPARVKELRAVYDKVAAEAVPSKSKPAAPDFKVPKVWGEQ
jgi:arylsulfatase A-like enzyme